MKDFNVFVYFRILALTENFSPGVVLPFKSSRAFLSFNSYLHLLDDSSLFSLIIMNS